MIRFGLRLTLAGGREALTRLVLIATAVTIGVGLLLAVLAGANAVNTQIDRFAWLNTQPVTAQNGGGSLWWFQSFDFYEGTRIDRVDVAALKPEAPVPPGIPRLPGPGEYYASPALRAKIAAAPADQLAARYPGREVGTIGREALQSPESLLLIVGRTPAQLSSLPGAERIDQIGQTVPQIAADALDLILAVIATGLLFPVLIFIGTATRLSAARREQRFAAMRLVGATPRQISVISAVEAGVAAIAGTLLGFGLFALLRGPVSKIPFSGTTFFYSDLSLTVGDVVLVAVGVPVCAAVAARIALRRVRISPLGVTRQTTPRPPSPWRMTPLVLGLVELTYFIGRRPPTGPGQTAAYLPGFLLIMTGLVLGGPWLTMVGARMLARRSNRPATLIAARRLADNPRAGFRAVSGLVIALFVTSAATGIISTIVDNRGTHLYAARAATTLEKNYDDADRPTAVPVGLVGDLRSIPGVRSVLVIRLNPNFGPVRPGRQTPPDSLAACADLAPLREVGHCAPGAAVAKVWGGYLAGVNNHGVPDANAVWPASPVTVAELDRLPIGTILVGTDGTTAAIERARTRLEAGYPTIRFPPSTVYDGDSDITKALVGWRRLADVVIVISLVIAGCGLAVSIAGGLSERKRPFSLLRLSGAPLKMLRRVVTLESAVPLLSVALVAIGAGLLAAHLFLVAQLDYHLRPPGFEYYLIVVVGLAASLGIIASTLPFLGRITGPETARNE